MNVENEKLPAKPTGRRYDSVRALIGAEGVSQEVQEKVEEIRRETKAVLQLAKLRQSAGLTQEDMAKYLNVTQSAISKLEAGRDEDVTLREIKEYAKATNQRIGVLFGKPLTHVEAELRFSLMESAIGELKSQLNSLAESKTRIIAINTFSPEPYELLKPLLVSVQPCEDAFEAGWFDANIHTCGDNEEEAIANLKSLILDYFDSFSNEPADQLGIEPTRQLAILNTFISKKA